LTSYTKLFSSIVTSTIWCAPHPTRVVWITMLAMADKNGEVAATVPGLARMANVTIDECETALTAFLSPDPHSRTPDEDGRRIEAIDGGWALINHAKYRAMASRDEQKSAAALRQQRYRQRNARNGSGVTRNENVTPSNATVTQTLHIAEAEAEADRITQTKQAPSGLSGQPEIIYQAYPLKVGKAKALVAIRKAIKSGISPDSLLERTQAYAAAVSRWTPAQRYSPEGRDFVPHPASWFNAARYEDDPSTWERKAPVTPTRKEDEIIWTN
jgi:hypothetical protein